MACLEIIDGTAGQVNWQIPCKIVLIGVENDEQAGSTITILAVLRIMSNLQSPESDTYQSDRSVRWGWYLFDFSNSILVINGSIYFPQWIVGPENRAGDFWFNMVFVVSSLAILALGPIIGLIADRFGNRLKLLALMSLGLVLSGVVVGMSPAIVDRSTRVWVAMIGFFFVLVFYQLSLVFYNAMLNYIADRSDDVKYSGRALAWGWMGGIAAIFFGLIFSNGMLPSIGTAGMASLLPSAILTGLLTLASLWLMRGAKPRTPIVTSTQLKSPLSVKAALRTLFSNRMTLLFLLSYFLYSDAILTLQNNSPIFLDQVHGFSDDTKAYLFLMALLTGAVGAISATSLARRVGLATTLRIVLVGWIAVTITSGITNNAALFTLLFAVMGLLNGAIWNVSRVLFHRRVPDEIRNASFGLYSTFERAASVLGPVAWSLFLYLGTGAAQYQIGWVGMSIFIIISLWIFRSYREGESDNHGRESL